MIGIVLHRFASKMIMFQEALEFWKGWMHGKQTKKISPLKIINNYW
jgi:hypothetical protein